MVPRASIEKSRLAGRTRSPLEERTRCCVSTLWQRTALGPRNTEPSRRTSLACRRPQIPRAVVYASRPPPLPLSSGLMILRPSVFWNYLYVSSLSWETPSITDCLTDRRSSLVVHISTRWARNTYLLSRLSSPSSRLPRGIREIRSTWRIRQHHGTIRTLGRSIECWKPAAHHEIQICRIQHSWSV